MIRCVWGHDVEAPRLELARPLPPRALGLVRKGSRIWREYFDERHESRPELLRTYHGRWPKQGPPLLDWHQWKRSESAELHARLGQLLLVHADVVTGYVGQLDAAGELRPFTYRELMDRLQCSRGQLKRAIKKFRAAGYIRRHQPRDFDPTKEQPYKAGVPTLKVTRAFWGASRVLAERDRRRAKIQREAAAQADAESARERYQHQAARDRVGALLDQLAKQAGTEPAQGWRRELAINAELDRRKPPPT